MALDWPQLSSESILWQVPELHALLQLNGGTDGGGGKGGKGSDGGQARLRLAAQLAGRVGTGQLNALSLVLPTSTAQSTQFEPVGHPQVEYP